MGWNFRRSMTLCKGVRLNFGKNGMSVSSGVKGFRKTYNLTTGQTTTTFGIPGTGIYYTSREGGKKKKDESYSPNTQRQMTPNAYDVVSTNYSGSAATIDIDELSTMSEPQVVSETKYETQYVEKKKQLTHEEVKNICRIADDKIDWFEILSSRRPIDNFFNVEAWDYLHAAALKVCQGDIDTYLKVIQDINPYNDLLDYIDDVEFGANEADEIYVSFSAKTDGVDESDEELFEDYVCACAVRIARDTFALLPVKRVRITAEVDGQVIVDANFDIDSFSKIKFAFSDPSQIVDYYSS